MKGFLFLFITSFSIFAGAYVDQPAQCLKDKKFPCAVRVTDRTDKFEMEKFKFFAAPAATVIFNADNSIRLLEGGIWILQAQELKVEGGVVDFYVSGHVWLEKSNQGRILAYNLLGDLQAQLFNSKSKEVIPVGFQNWFDGMLDAKTVNHGVIAPIEPLSFLSRCIKVQALPKKNLVGHLKKYRLAWADNLNQAGELYAQIVERRIASYQEKQERAYQAYLNNLKQQQQLRTLYRDRYYNP